MGIGLGIGRGHAPKSEPTLWLLQDEFATDLAAGSVNGTAAEPGPGTRTVVDTGNRLSISSGSAVIYPNSAWNNEILHYSNVSSVSAGRLLISKIKVDSVHEGRMSFGDDLLSHGFLWSGLRTWTPGTTIGGQPVNGAWQIYALIARPAGLFFLVKTSSWRLLWIRTHTAPSNLSVHIEAASTSVSVDYVRVPAALWLPTPLASDGFGSAFGTTDGLGHAEGIAGGIGAGGSGVSWSNAGNTWSTSGGKAINTAPSGLAQQISVASLGVADVFAGVAMVRALSQQVGLALNVDNASSPQNGVLVYSDGAGNIKVDKIVSGVQSNVATTAFTYSAGARLIVVKNGSEYRVYYNNALVTAQIISDASIISNTLHGLFSTDASNTLDDFTCYATGTGGEYAELDKWS